MGLQKLRVALLIGFATVATGLSAQERTPARGDGMLPATGPTVAVATFDIAGVRLGMTPTQARAAMTASGFRPPAVDPETESWEGLIAEAVAKRRNQTAKRSVMPMSTMAQGPAKQRLEVWYAASPAGPLVASIKYSVASDQVTGALFRERLTAKYGPPTQTGWGKTLLWCSFGERRCLPYGNRDQPYLSGEPGFDLHTLTVNEGELVGSQRSAALRAEIDRRAPPTAPTNF